MFSNTTSGNTVQSFTGDRLIQREGMALRRPLGVFSETDVERIEWMADVAIKLQPYWGLRFTISRVIDRINQTEPSVLVTRDPQTELLKQGGDLTEMYLRSAGDLPLRRASEGSVCLGAGGVFRSTFITRGYRASLYAEVAVGDDGAVYFLDNNEYGTQVHANWSGAFDNIKTGEQLEPATLATVHQLRKA